MENLTKKQAHLWIKGEIAYPAEIAWLSLGYDPNSRIQNKIGQLAIFSREFWSSITDKSLNDRLHLIQSGIDIGKIEPIGSEQQKVKIVEVIKWLKSKNEDVCETLSNIMPDEVAPEPSTREEIKEGFCIHIPHKNEFMQNLAKLMWKYCDSDGVNKETQYHTGRELDKLCKWTLPSDPTKSSRQSSYIISKIIPAKRTQKQK